jgi:uncharacterized repeat protein (TIGR01451 family)
MKCSFVPFSLDGIQPIILNDEDGDNIYTITLNVSGEETIYFMTYPDLVDDNLEFEFSESGIADCVQSYPLTTSLPNFRTYNRTGLPETLHIIYNSCEIYTGAEDYGIVDGNIFVDTNQDGEFNGTDFPASNISVLYDETNLGDITGNSGVFLFDTAIGDHEFTVQLPENFICTTGNEVMNATVISGSNNHLDSVGIYSDILIPQFETSIHAVITCSESGFYIIGLTNTGMFPFDAIVELTIDPAVIFDASELPVDSIVGNTYFMTWESLNPFEYNEIYFYVIWPNFELMGVPLTSTLNICTVGGVTCMQETWTSPVLCAYDPNDKSVTPAGWTDAGYILNGTELEYLVRFQNTGNAPATNVRIEDVLDTDLDWTSLHIIGSSHTLTEFEINEDGRAKFFFDGIMLPDSTSDEVGSHGYVLFRIMPDENLPVFTEIENTSEIYFDFNPAVITNTVHNTIFDCSLMTTDIVMEAAACVGELYIQNQPVEYAENYTWTLEDNVVDTNEVLNYQTSEPGTLNFQFEASNPLCAVNFNFPVNVHALPSVPTITQNGNELVATSGGMFYVWYLNDELISQGTSNSFVASESGIYTVSITNEFGCSTLSESVSIAVGISELNALQWSVSPNPATTQITVQCAFAGKKSITLYNALNQIVYTSSMFTNTFVLERNDLPAGVYYLDLVVEGAQISDSKKIIFE